MSPHPNPTLQTPRSQSHLPRKIQPHAHTLGAVWRHLHTHPSPHTTNTPHHNITPHHTLLILHRRPITISFKPASHTCLDSKSLTSPYSPYLAPKPTKIHQPNPTQPNHPNAVHSFSIIFFASTRRMHKPPPPPPTHPRPHRDFLLAVLAFLSFPFLSLPCPCRSPHPNPS